MPVIMFSEFSTLFEDDNNLSGTRPICVLSLKTEDKNHKNLALESTWGCPIYGRLTPFNEIFLPYFTAPSIQFPMKHIFKVLINIFSAQQLYKNDNS